MSISVIIPTFNEADTVAETIMAVRKHTEGKKPEIIVTDGGSTDQTIQRAKDADAKVIRCPQQGRAAQMNYGAKHAGEPILYFLHADSHPPPNFDTAIKKAMDHGFKAGCFRLSFDDNHPLLQFYEWFTHFDIDLFRFGDQSLFIEQEAFVQLQGFKEDHIVMEDQEMVRRIKRHYSFQVLEDSVTTSARRYRENGIVKLQLVFTLILSLYYMGASQQQLIAIYNRFID